METINWKVEGMSCTGCAQTIDGYLQKKGMQEVKVSLVGGDVSFQSAGTVPESLLKKGIEHLGYHVAGPAGENPQKKVNKFLRFLMVCAPFTVVLLLPMLTGMRVPLLMNGWFQLIICLPVYITGMYFFGRSAVGSLRVGRPNMNVLIALGATAAFLYSVTGTLLGLGESYLFYETTALIITLVFAGNYIEERSIRSTQSALNGLVISQSGTSTMIAFDDQHQEILFPVDSRTLRAGDLLLLKSGDQVPTDCRILSGEASMNESIITGESLPVFKKSKDDLLGGSLVADGVIKVQVMAAPGEAALSKIVDLVKRAQSDKPPVQLLADRISLVFVPVVIAIAMVTLLLNYFILHDLTSALMRSIAVLVIACPCAMGLATPAAIAVGLGRAARNGVLFRDASGLEKFTKIRQVIFDKTGTLTTGQFHISQYKITDSRITDTDFKSLLSSLEKYSNHPIAQSIVRNWKRGNTKWSAITEKKGAGVEGKDGEGNIYRAGSYRFAGCSHADDSRPVYLSRNEELLGWVDVSDTVRPEAAAIMEYFRNKKIRTVLLSGDRLSNCTLLAGELGIDEVIAGQTPAQKMQEVVRLQAIAPAAMIGDGINDAPALAKASIGISMSDASQIAMQTSDVVLMNSGLRKLPLALELGSQTFLTIRQNLFWAFLYNIVAIPIAATGLLTPAVAALAMGFSDVVLLINSSRLYIKKLL